MQPKELPFRPSLEQYKKQAKDLLHSHQSGDPGALARIKRHHPRLGKLPEAELRTAKFALTGAQLIVAREHGFESWPAFAKHIEARNQRTSADPIWRSAENSVIAGDVATLERLLREHEDMFRDRQPPSFGSGGLRPDYSGGDARTIVARNHHFESWVRFEEHKEALKIEKSAVAQFEAAVDAIAGGGLAALKRLLRDNPAVIRARSTRKHRATLLHYVGANGVEYFRQKTPKNAVTIAKVLLKAGAAVDAEAEIYGGSTALGLVATSIHPLQAGVQNALIETLLSYGASIDGGFGGANSGGYTHGAVNGCLGNGRGEAAELLARRGARLDLAGAAGVGRLDLVKGFFDVDGALKADVASEQLKTAFAWACQYGRTGVVEFLLQKGFEAGAKLVRHGETGLHWAAHGGHLDIVKLLLARNAPVGVKDETWGGTPLGWALHGWSDLRPAIGARRYDRVAALLVSAGSEVEPEWLASEKLRADPRMLAALRRETPR